MSSCFTNLPLNLNLVVAMRALPSNFFPQRTLYLLLLILALYFWILRFLSDIE